MDKPYRKKRETAADLLASFNPTKTPSTPQHVRTTYSLLPTPPATDESITTSFTVEVTSPLRDLSFGSRLDYDINLGLSTNQDKWPLGHSKSILKPTTVVSPATFRYRLSDPVPFQSDTSAVTSGTSKPTFLEATPKEPTTPEFEISPARTLRTRPAQRVPFNFSRRLNFIPSPTKVKTSVEKQQTLSSNSIELAISLTMATNVRQLQRDRFYRKNQSLFLPLLPPNNYVSKLLNRSQEETNESEEEIDSEINVQPDE